jgi:hypothetical protein
MDEDGWADVGPRHNGLARRSMAALTDAGCTRFVLEHDNPSDDARFARRARAFMESLA